MDVICYHRQDILFTRYTRRRYIYSYMLLTQRDADNIDNKVKETIRKYTNHMDL